MTTGQKLILALGGAGLAYAAFRWWEGQQAPTYIAPTGPVSMPPLGAPPVAAAGALPAYVPPPPPPPAVGPATETRSGRGHF